MENQIYRLEGTDNSFLEVVIIDTNSVEPLKDTREVSIEFLQGAKQCFFSMELSEAKSLLQYLKSAIEFCEDFNEKSKPKESNK